MKRAAALLVLAVAASSSAARAQSKGTLPPPPAPPPGAVERDWTQPGAPPLRPEVKSTPPVAPAAPVAPAPTPAVFEPPPPDVTHEPQPRRWYGYQTLIVDAASGLLVAAGSTGKEDGTLIALGVIGYGLGSPLVHSFHGHGGKFWGSFGLRLGMPLGLALMGTTACPHDDACPLAGALIGVAGAVAIDAAVIAREDAPRPTFVIAPSVDSKHAGIVLGGTF